MILNKLNHIIDKYTTDCKKIKLIATDIEGSQIKEFMERHHIKKISSEVDDFDDSCVIIIWNHSSVYNESTIKFINEYVRLKKVFILMVPVKFDFHSLVVKCISSSLDAISWRDKDGNKYPEYCIVIKND